MVDLLFHLPDATSTAASAPPSPAPKPATSSPWKSRWCARASRQHPPALACRGDRRHRFRRTGVLQVHRERQMPVGAKLLVSGKMEGFSGRRTMSHPEHIVPADRPDQLPAIEPVWPLTGGLWPRQVAGAMAQALTRLPPCPSGTTQHCCGERNGPHSPSLARRPNTVQAPPRPTARGRAWPTTNCWPDRSPRR